MLMYRWYLLPLSKTVIVYAGMLGELGEDVLLMFVEGI